MNATQEYTIHSSFTAAICAILISAACLFVAVGSVDASTRYFVAKSVVSQTA